MKRNTFEEIMERYNTMLYRGILLDDKWYFKKDIRDDSIFEISYFVDSFGGNVKIKGIWPIPLRQTVTLDWWKPIPNDEADSEEEIFSTVSSEQLDFFIREAICLLQ